MKLKKLKHLVPTPLFFPRLIFTPNSFTSFPQVAQVYEELGLWSVHKVLSLLLLPPHAFLLLLQHRSLLQNRVFRELLQCCSFPPAAVLHELLQHESFPSGTVLQEWTAPPWGPPQAAGCISAPLWSSMGCKETICITMVFTMGCREICSGALHTSFLSFFTALGWGLFLSHFLIPLS